MMIPPRSYPNCFSFCTNLTSGPEDTKVLGFAADYDEKANTTVNENDLPVLATTRFLSYRKTLTRQRIIYSV